MNKFFARAAQQVRSVFTVDPVASRLLEKTYVDVALSSHFGGN